MAMMRWFRVMPRTEGDMKNESLCSTVHRWFPVPPVPVLLFVLTQIIDYLVIILQTSTVGFTSHAPL